jgi:hypothetical protein
MSLRSRLFGEQKKKLPDFIQKKTASIHANPEFCCIRTMSGYRLLSVDPDAESYLLESTASYTQIGECVLKAIAASRLIDVKEIASYFDYEKKTQQYKKWVADISEKYGYKNRRELFNKMRSCDAEEYEGVITIKPTFHETLEGFSGEGILESEYVRIPSESLAEDVGKAVLLALSRCKGKGAI